MGRDDLLGAFWRAQMATTFHVEDDLVHTPEPNPGWRESYYFSCFDEVANVGLWHSIGKRPLKGYSGFALGVWGAYTLASFETDTMRAHDNHHVVKGLEYHYVAATRRWQLSFKGPLIDCSSPAVRLDPASMTDPGRHPERHVDVRFELEFEPIGPPYVYARDPRWTPLFSGHIDQVGRYRGWVEVGAHRFNLDCWGGNDHSWGTRDWFAPRTWRWFDVHFGEGGPNIVLWKASFPGVDVMDGAVYRDGGMYRISSFEEKVDTVAADPKPVPAAFTALFRDSGGAQIELSGQVEKTFPVVFRSRDGERVSWNDRGMVRCQWHGHTGYGNVEFAETLSARSQ